MYLSWPVAQLAYGILTLCISAAKHSEPGGVVGGQPNTQSREEWWGKPGGPPNTQSREEWWGGGGDQEGNQTFRAGRSGGGDQEGSSWLVARLAYGISTLCISPGQLPG